jgi:phosphate transport system substrate-binding protein
MKKSVCRAVLGAVVGIGYFSVAADDTASAETLRIQGSVAVANQLMVPYQNRIEHVTGHQLSIVQSKASLGLLALFNGEADLAMVAAPLNEAVALLRQTRPELPFHRLRSFPVLETRVAFPVNPDNPVRRVTLAKLKQVMSGQIDNWRELGGPDLPIHIVSVTDGGGTRLTTQNALLDGQPIAAHSEIRVELPDEVVKTVAQDRGALGITQTALVKRHHLPELRMETSVGHPLQLVSLGEPTEAMLAVIAAARGTRFEEDP